MPPFDPNAPYDPLAGNEFYTPNYGVGGDPGQNQQWPQMPPMAAPMPPMGMGGGMDMMGGGEMPWGGGDYFVDANGYTSEPEFDHKAARDKIVQYRKEAAARRRRQMLLAEKKAEQMRIELERESEAMKQRQVCC